MNIKEYAMHTWPVESGNKNHVVLSEAAKNIDRVFTEQENGVFIKEDFKDAEEMSDMLVHFPVTDEKRYRRGKDLINLAIEWHYIKFHGAKQPDGFSDRLAVYSESEREMVLSSWWNA